MSIITSSSMSSWDLFFFDICDTISKKSKDPSTKVGAVIVNSGNSIISTGYNGFPIGVDDNVNSFPERYERPEKYSWICHAEENAISFAARNGISTKDSVLYVNRMIPCSRCTRLIIQSGIKEIRSRCDAGDSTQSRWAEDNRIAMTMLDEAGTTLVKFV